jgi:segregation and condensation protein A
MSLDLRVQTPEFEGPIDLLLTLAQRQQVDLNQVRLADLAWDYLNGIRADAAAGQTRAPEELAAFLVVASRLLALKAAALLPSAGGEDEEEDLESWEEQVRQRMVEYARFKEAAMELMKRHQEGGASFPSAIEAEIIPLERLAIDAGGLATAFQAVLDRLPTPEEVSVELSSYSLSEEMDSIRARLRSGESTSFNAIFASAQTRLHAVVIFLALLELVRTGEAGFRQRSVFADIEITLGAGHGG